MPSVKRQPPGFYPVLGFEVSMRMKTDALVIIDNQRITIDFALYTTEITIDRSSALAKLQPSS
jgi:hypothetical protein